MTDADRISTVENNLIGMEIAMKSMAKSVDKLAETVSDYRILADRTIRHADSIVEIRDSLHKIQLDSSNSCASVATNNNNALNAFRKELEAMDMRLDLRGDSRLKWGLGIALMVTLTLYGTTLTTLNSISDVLKKQSTQNYYIEKKIEELIDNAKQH